MSYYEATTWSEQYSFGHYFLVRRQTNRGPCVGECSYGFDEELRTFSLGL